MTAPLPMGNQKITGLADPTVSTDAVTKNYADTQVASFFSTGDVKLTLKTVADTGWIMFVDGTIGNTGSNATIANSTTQALFTLLYNNIGDASAPVRTSSGVVSSRAAQGSASAAWAANCQVQTPAALGRALGVSGAGAGLTSRQLGAATGEEAHLLITSEIPAHNHVNTLNDPGHVHSYGLANNSSGGSLVSAASGTAVNTQNAFTNITITNANAGGGLVHNNMQPTMFLNAMVKL